MYRRCASIINSVEKERQLYKILPLFCVNCSQYGGQLLVTKFPEVYDFAEDVADVFVSHVRQSAQASHTARWVWLWVWLEIIVCLSLEYHNMGVCLGVWLGYGIISFEYHKMGVVRGVVCG